MSCSANTAPGTQVSWNTFFAMLQGKKLRFSVWYEITEQETPFYYYQYMFYKGFKRRGKKSIFKHKKLGLWNIKSSIVAYYACEIQRFLLSGVQKLQGRTQSFFLIHKNVKLLVILSVSARRS